MELLNATGMPAGYTLGMQPDGRELLVVAIKGTFMIPPNGAEPTLAAEQVPLVEADSFTGEPGFSATLYESDYAPCKPRCDVLFNGSAYAPGGKSAKRVRVSLQVGPISKSFDVVGNRVWKKRLGFIRSTSPEPFTVMPISYNNAFGGIDNTHKKEKKHRAYLTNPVGIGFHSNRKVQSVRDQPLPNTEEIGRRIKKPHGEYNPMALGPIGRSWSPRLKYAGTYDDNWLEDVFPFLPADFDDAYYQSAPIDQQINHLRGGEEVVLSNLTPQGRTAFRMPTIDLPVEFTDASYERTEKHALLDTVMIEPDLGRFTLTWRASHPLKRNLLEMRQCVIGRQSRAWHRARNTGKTYYSSLRTLIAARRSDEEDEE
jgi:hypothetical protein